MEQTAFYDLARAHDMQKNDTRYDLHVHSIRRKLADVDGISIKATLDAIVSHPRSVFKDDSPRVIRSVSISQEIGKQETTTFTFTPCQ